MKNKIIILMTFSLLIQRIAYTQNYFPVKFISGWDYIDENGKRVTFHYFDKAMGFSENLAPTYKDGYGWRYLKYDKVNSNLEEIPILRLSNDVYVYANSFSNGLASVKKDNEKWYFINDRFKRVSKKINDGSFSYIGKYFNGIYCLISRDCKCFNMKGNLIFRIGLMEYTNFDDFDGKCIMLMTTNGIKYFDQKGKEINDDSLIVFDGKAYINYDNRIEVSYRCPILVDTVTYEHIFEPCESSFLFPNQKDSICIVNKGGYYGFYNYNTRSFIIDSLDDVKVKYFETPFYDYNNIIGFGDKLLAAVVYKQVFCYINRKGEIVWKEKELEK